MAGVFLSGLASGLDTESIVSQLMQLEMQKVTAVQKRQIGIQQHKDDLNAVKTKLDAFKTAATALSTASTWKATQTASSSDPTRIDATLLGGAGIGGHSIQVEKLASSSQQGFTFTPNAAAGSLSLFYGTDPLAPDINKVSIEIPANATAAEIATAINANEGSPVYAAVVKDGLLERLVLSARKTGEHSNFTVDSSALAGGQLTDVPAYTREGAVLNASYKLDDELVSRSSESNIVENAIPGGQPRKSLLPHPDHPEPRRGRRNHQRVAGAIPRY
jgi:flagellar hook-associated protein 2